METIEYKGYTIETWVDDYAESPRSPRVWDNLSTFAFELRDYVLPNDVSIDYSQFNSMDEAEAYMRKNFDVLELLPVSAYIHSVVSLSVGSPTCNWDSGYIGFIVIEKQKVREYYNIKRITKEFKKRAIEIAKIELETYSEYLNGKFYGFSTLDDEGELVDSCGGFYGYDHEDSGLLDMARDFIDSELERKAENKYERIKTFIKNNVPLNVRMQYLTQ